MDHDLYWPDVATETTIPQEQVATRKGTWARAFVREFLQTILPALLIALGVNSFIAQPTRVDGTSMEPTLHGEERLIIEKVSYRLHAPARGDIVVLQLSGRERDPLIKRVIGLPGEVVAVRNGQVYVDGKPLGEPYLNQVTSGYVAPQLVPEGHVFVLGDNRGASNDSRIFGMVPLDDLVGRAWLSYWPLNTIGPIH